MASRSLVWILLAGLPLAGCGMQWDLSKPISLSVESPEIDAATAHMYFDEGVRQLGGIPAASAAQVVHMRFTTSCYGCTPLTVEHVDYQGDTIWILPRQKLEPMPAGISEAIKHGLGHVLGAGHLPAETHAMMAPLFCDVADPFHYSAADKQYICTQARVRCGAY